MILACALPLASCAGTDRVVVREATPRPALTAEQAEAFRCPPAPVVPDVDAPDTVNADIWEYLARLRLGLHGCIAVNGRLIDAATGRAAP